MDTSESLMVFRTIDGHVLHMLSFHAFHHFFNICHSFGTLSHGLGGEVGVASRSVPVWEELALEANGKSFKFGASLEKISGSPEVISLSETFAWTNLVFPLTWHNFGVGPGDFKTSI